MIRVAFAALVLILAAELPGGGAKADPFPWCAVFSGPLSGVRDCSFTTFEQCLATVSGVGGMCSQNPWYAAPQRQRRSRWR